MTTHPTGSLGPATDRRNDPVIDPSVNVVALVDSAISRQDDLRDISHAAMELRLQDLKELLDERYRQQTQALAAAFASAEKAVQAALAAAEKATSKAEVAADKRADSQNEFRGQLADQAQTFMPRKESEALSMRASERIDDVNTLLAGSITRVEVATAIASISARHQELSDRVTKSEGRDAGAGVIEQLAGIKSQVEATSSQILSGQGNTQGRADSRASLYAGLAAIAALVVIVNVIIALATK